MLDEHGFGDHGTRAARPGESGDCRQQMQNKDGQIAHGTILARIARARNAREFSNSPWTRDRSLRVSEWRLVRVSVIRQR